eukprot:CAMPEP_0115891162 /NCGR_PEP_ID=MMETSP0287-20121206/33721_1 /TAXON_ID=412157 /ORGANISM="Chrysochromulina rotalis, Strain UIO044" /LENGTH=319 /DNA_ID=CAMNT_0003347949 /DNA_START=236 /DNA_END=1195 /DNA_ORIENTATION=-
MPKGPQHHEDEIEVEEVEGDGGGDGDHKDGGGDDEDEAAREEKYVDTLVNDVISPLLWGVGASGFISAIASLLGGLLAICGAAGRTNLLLRTAACLSAVGAVLLLCVGAAVTGGLLTAGQNFVFTVLKRDFPVRAARCVPTILQYARWVGRALLTLSGCCALGAIGAIGGCDASCKAASTIANAATDTESQALFGGDFEAGSGTSGGGLRSFGSPPSAAARGAKNYLARLRAERATSSMELHAVQMPHDDIEVPPAPSQPVQVHPSLSFDPETLAPLQGQVAAASSGESFDKQLVAASAVASGLVQPANVAPAAPSSHI